MKINLPQLEPEVRKGLSNIYVISGDDPVLKNDAIRFIRKAAKQAGFTERTRLAPDAGLDEDQLYTSLYSPSLTADKAVLELDLRSKAPVKSVAGILAEYAKKPTNDILLIIDIAKLDDAAKRSAWYKAVEKSGTVVTVWPISREQLPQWIKTRGKRYKLDIPHDAAMLLADYVEGNLTAAAQTIEKLYLLKHDKPIDSSVIKSVLADESRFTVFDLTEAMISEDKARTIHILKTLQIDGMEPTIVLWGITRELRILANLMEGYQNGSSWDELFRKNRIFSRRQGLVRRFLSHFSINQCHQCLTQAADIDRTLKGALPGNPWDAMQLLCLRLGCEV